MRAAPQRFHGRESFYLARFAADSPEAQLALPPARSIGYSLLKKPSSHALADETISEHRPCTATFSLIYL
jgi:hypothetical protein